MSRQRNYICSVNSRSIIVNGLQRTVFPSNAISTTKYGVLNFIPLFLFEQFHNYTNCFFLLISVIQQFPEASSLGRFTTIIPLCIILAVSAVKEILEDIQRYREDKKENLKIVEVLKNHSWSQTEWKNVQVGDIVKVYNNEFFPADLLFIDCSNENGICYIETVNLDGENNLKIRRRIPCVNQNKDLNKLRGTIECEHPNELIYNFNGILKIDDDVSVPLNAKNILLRGSILRHTNWISGLVVYSGNDTKIRKNSKHTRMKRSSVSLKVNTQIIILFVLFLSYSIVHWILFLIWNNNYFSTHWYLPISEQSIFENSSIIIALVFGVIYAILIPISLQVMQDLSRYIQGIFINNDLDMFYEPRDIPALVKTSSLNEDLGLVKYIFADKTGTLTKNILEFQCCSVGGHIYKTGDKPDLSEQSSYSLYHFLIAICVCPGVVPCTSNDEITYCASSPDHKALISACRDFGCTLIKRDYNSAELKMNNEIKTYKILNEFEFSSDRRRTSVIVQDSHNKLFLYVMGADDIIFSKLNQKNEYRDITSKHIEEFSAKSLRSLCIAMAEIKEVDYKKWYPSYKKAISSLELKDELMEICENEIVSNLILLGATGLVDQLQDDVPETILTFLEAGINVWMLTGDKEETAINIGNSCRLLFPETPLIKLNSENLEKLNHIVDYHAKLMGSRFGNPGNNFALLVTGGSLKILLDSENDAVKFVTLMLSCKTVICCRTTPKQKALVVTHVQKITKFVTLAVGDGANDVAMIQTASIGVGISGMEGLQAANAADYSVGQFRYLRKLLLVHGTWNYNRICKLIYFISYKNVAIATIQFCYTATTGWSGQICFDRWAKMVYNVMLTSAPTLALGIFEKNLSQDILINKPYAYTRNNWFNMRHFSVCLINAFLHSALLTWLSLKIFNTNVFWSSGKTDDYMIVGNAIYTSLITIVCLKSCLHTINWTHLTVLFVIGSELVWIMVLMCLSYTWPLLYMGEDMPGVGLIIFSTPTFWLYFLLIIVTILGIDLIFVVLYRTFGESIINILKNSPSLRNES